VCCDDHTAIIRICDRGIGIPASDLPYVQEAFHRGSNVGDVTGTGLGLSVVKTCVELHRGEWTIDSKEGQGTEVTVKLPLE
jgi:signal transduction histidine kinase